MAEFRVRRRMEGRGQGWEWRQGRRVAFLVNGEAARCVRVGLGWVWRVNLLSWLDFIWTRGMEEF